MWSLQIISGPVSDISLPCSVVLSAELLIWVDLCSKLVCDEPPLQELMTILLAGLGCSNLLTIPQSHSILSVNVLNLSSDISLGTVLAEMYSLA